MAGIVTVKVADLVTDSVTDSVTGIVAGVVEIWELLIVL